jgi:thioredoxin-related protein
MNVPHVVTAFAIAVALGVSSIDAQAPTAAERAAATLLKNAFQKTTAEKKNVWVVFTSSSCDPCRKLEAFLGDPEIKGIIAANFVVVSLAVQESADRKALENPGGAELLSQLGAAAVRLPFSAFLDSKGRRIADSRTTPEGGNIGFPGNRVELDAFVKLIDRAALHLTDVTRAKIVDYLTRNVPQSPAFVE